MGLTEETQNSSSCLWNSQILSLSATAATATVHVSSRTLHGVYFCPFSKHPGHIEIQQKLLLQHIIIDALHIAIQILLTSHSSEAYWTHLIPFACITSFKLSKDDTKASVFWSHQPSSPTLLEVFPSSPFPLPNLMLYLTAKVVAGFHLVLLFWFCLGTRRSYAFHYHATSFEGSLLCLAHKRL